MMNYPHRCTIFVVLTIISTSISASRKALLFFSQSEATQSLLDNVSSKQKKYDEDQDEEKIILPKNERDAVLHFATYGTPAMLAALDAASINLAIKENWLYSKLSPAKKAIKAGNLFSFKTFMERKLYTVHEELELLRYLIKNKQDDQSQAAMLDILLIEKPSLIRSDSHNHVLFVAITAQQPEIVQKLLDAKADPNARNFQEETALMVAAQYENPAILKLLLEANANLQADFCGFTVFDLIINYGEDAAKTLKILICDQ